MTSLIVDNIFSYLSQEDRYNLFTLVCDLIGGNFRDKALALGIEQSTYYQYKNKNLDISDDKTIDMLKLLLNKDQNKLNEFLVPIVKQKQEHLSSMLELIQPTSTPQPVSAELLTTGTVGFTCRKKFLSNLISMISLGEIIFPYIVLNFDFDSKMVWWGNKHQPGSIYKVINKGFFTYDYVDNCWGNGTVGLEASKLLADLKSIKARGRVTFWADLKTGIFGVRRGDMSSDDETITNQLIPLKYITNAPKKTMTLNPNDDYTPLMKATSEQFRFRYGANYNISELKGVVSRAEEFHENHVSFTLYPNPSPAIKVIFQNKDMKRESEIKLITKYSILKVPPIQIKYSTPLTLLKSVVESYKDQEIVYLRFSEHNNLPIYLMKKDEEGVSLFVSGVLIEGFIPQKNSEPEE